MFWKQRRVLRFGAAATLIFGVGIAATATPAQAGVDRAGLDVSVSVNGPGAPDVRAGLTLEVYQDAGGGATGAMVAGLTCDTALEPATEYSAGFVSSCDLPVGDYLIGLDGVPANWQVGGSCTDGSAPAERLMLDGGEAFSFFGGSNASCSLFLNSSALLIDKVVVGGDASSSDFVLEVLDANGDVVASGSDVADATCAADFDTDNCGVIALLPAQGYTIAEPTVADYELTSVECDEFVRADQAPDGGAMPVDIGDDGFRTDDGDTYCVVTNTYVPPPTTTSTTTTTTTTTTVLPTTTVQPTTTVLATTTSSIDAAGITLPPTGTSSSTNRTMAVTAITLIGLGGVLLSVRRRASR